MGEFCGGVPDLSLTGASVFVRGLMSVILSS